MKFLLKFWNNKFEVEFPFNPQKRVHQMNNYARVIESKFAATFDRIVNKEKQKIALRATEKKERLKAFVKAVAQFNTPASLEGLVQEKFGCKYNELTPRRQKIYSAVSLLSQKIDPEHVARQVGMKLFTVQKWHSVYMTKGFTGVKQNLNKVGRKSA